MKTILPHFLFLRKADLHYDVQTSFPLYAFQKAARLVTVSLPQHSCGLHEGDNPFMFTTVYPAFKDI